MSADTDAPSRRQHDGVVADRFPLGCARSGDERPAGRAGIVDRHLPSSTDTWAWTREISSSRTTMGVATARRTLSSLSGSRPITYERSSGKAAPLSRTSEPTGWVTSDRLGGRARAAPGRTGRPGRRLVHERSTTDRHRARRDGSPAARRGRVGPRDLGRHPTGGCRSSSPDRSDGRRDPRCGSRHAPATPCRPGRRARSAGRARPRPSRRSPAPARARSRCRVRTPNRRRTRAGRARSGDGHRPAPRHPTGDVPVGRVPLQAGRGSALVTPSAGSGGRGATPSGRE